MNEHRVTLLPSGQTFHVRENELVLDAAIRQDIEITYTCRNGTCRTCLATVHEGTVVQEDPDVCLITEQELAANRRLLCMSTLKSDAVVEPKLKTKPKSQQSAI